MKYLSPVLPFLAWLFSSVLIVPDWVAVRELVVVASMRVTGTVSFERQAESGWFVHSIVPAVDRFAVLVFGVVGLALVLAFDYIYRAAWKKARLMRQFSLITGIQVGVFLTCRVLLIILGF